MLQLLLEVELDSGTRYYAATATGAKGRFFEPRVLSFGDVSREVPPLPGEFRTSDLSVELDNADNEFSRLKAETPFLNRRCNLLLGDTDKGLSDFTRIFSGKIRNWALDSERLGLDVVDVLSERFEPTVRWLITQGVFPHLPATTPAAIIPLVFGEVVSSAGGGALPAYLIDPGQGQLRFRYILCQGAAKSVDAVWNYGVLESPSNYTVVYGTGPAGIAVTYIDFMTDQRDPERVDELEITWDGQGLTDDDLPTGNLVENPARQFEQFLLRNGFTAADLDSASLTAAAATATTLGLKGAGAIVDPEETVREAVDKFSRSFNLLVFPLSSGELAVSLLSQSISDPGNLPKFEDSVNVVQESFAVRPQEEFASTLQISWQRNFWREEWEAAKDETDSVQVSRLGLDVRVEHELWFVRDERTRKLLSLDRLFFQREERQLARFAADPELARTIDLGSDVTLTHFAGIDEDGAGYVNRLLRVIGWRLAVDERDALLELLAVDFGILGVDFDFDSFEFGEEQGALLTNSLPPEAQAGEAPLLVDVPKIS